MLLQLLIKYLYVICMNDRCLLVKRLVQMEMVKINSDFTDGLNDYFQHKTIVNSTCLLLIDQHMPILGMGWRPLK